MKLSKNFSLEELTKSDTAVRRGISNVPSDDVTNNIQELVDNVLQPVRDRLGPVVVTSGYRSPELNTAIGGSNTITSTHTGAADQDTILHHTGSTSTFSITQGGAYDGTVDMTTVGSGHDVTITMDDQFYTFDVDQQYCFIGNHW